MLTRILSMKTLEFVHLLGRGGDIGERWGAIGETLTGLYSFGEVESRE
jgi:hypothetical protein